MIILTRSNSIYSSPRIEKYIEFCQAKQIDFLVIGWDRLNKNLQRDSTIFFRRQAGYNVGGFKAAVNRFSWIFFLLKVFLSKRRQVSTIHAFDLDTAFPACMFKFFFKRKVKVIFDICDWFSATLYNQNKIILYIFKKMEKFTIEQSDETIICEPERIEQIPYKLNRKELVVPNIPSFTDVSFLKYDDTYEFKEKKIVVSYVGGFNGYRLLDELLDIAEKGIINLLIAGYGSPEIEKRCNTADALPNIKYFGKVAYKDGLNIMFNSQLIYAMYSKSNPNHYYAAPNKYYEAMMLGKPILTTKGISLGTKVTTNKIGYAIDESRDKIEDFFLHLDTQDLVQRGNDALSLWNKSYKTHTFLFLNNKYIKLIK